MCCSCFLGLLLWLYAARPGSSGSAIKLGVCLVLSCWRHPLRDEPGYSNQAVHGGMQHGCMHEAEGEWCGILLWTASYRCVAGVSGVALSASAVSYKQVGQLPSISWLRLSLLLAKGFALLSCACADGSACSRRGPLHVRLMERDVWTVSVLFLHQEDWSVTDHGRNCECIVC